MKAKKKGKNGRVTKLKAYSIFFKVEKLTAGDLSVRVNKCMFAVEKHISFIL